MREMFIYVHTRPDTGQCFYVGKGTKIPNGRKFKTKYRRAFKTDNRNADWRKIVEGCGFNVQIVQEGIFEDGAASQAEKDWVSKYPKGTLVNRTIGGCGVSGFRPSRESIEKTASKIRGRRGFLCKNSKAVHVYKAATGGYIGVFGSAALAGESISIDRSLIGYALRKGRPHSKGYLFFYTFQGETVAPMPNPPLYNGPIAVISYDKNLNVIEKYESAQEAQRQTGIRATGIAGCCKGKDVTAGKLYWRYEKDGPLLKIHVKEKRPSGRKRKTLCPLAD